MTLMKTMYLPLFFLTVIATTADANYFSNPRTNVNFSVGSAPNPTPRDVRLNHQPQASLNADVAVKAKEATEREANNAKVTDKNIRIANNIEQFAR